MLRSALVRVVGSIAWTLLAVCTGCESTLGLDGLEFNREAELTRADAGDAGGDAGDSGVIDLVDGSAAPRPIAYPIQVRSSQSLVEQPDGPTSYFVYDRSSGALEQHELGEGQFVVSGEWDWVKDLSLVVSIPAAGGPALIGYDAEPGLVHYVQHAVPASTLVSERMAQSPGRTHLVPFAIAGSWYLVAYDRATGNYRLLSADLSATGVKVQTGKWPRAWTHLTGYPANADTDASGYVLKYDSASGDAELETIAPNTLSEEVVAAGNLGAGWTNLIAFGHESVTAVALYREDDGHVRAGILDASSGALVFESLEDEADDPAAGGAGGAAAGEQDRVWSEGVTAMVPVRSGRPYAVLQDRSAGVINVAQLDPVEEGGVIK
jgi:hypothetical protein